MIPFHTASHLVVTTLNFYALPQHPEAFLVREEATGLPPGNSFLIPRTTLTSLISEHTPVVEFYRSYQSGVSLPTNAKFWLVPREALTQANSKLSQYFSTVEDHLTDPDWVPIYQSNYDGQIWNLSGQPVLTPMEICLWGTRFNLEKVKTHLQELQHPSVLSFNIKKNDCHLNYDISGTHLGWLTIDISRLGIDFSHSSTGSVTEHLPQAHSNWIEDYVIHNYDSTSSYDVLGLHAFHLHA